MGIRLPIIKKGNDLAASVVDALARGMENGEFTLKDRDIVAVTESILARCQGNFVNLYGNKRTAD